MARARSRSRRSSKKKGSTPGTSADVFAAIHWFMLLLEKRAIELYATDATTYMKIRPVLATAVLALQAIKPTPKLQALDRQCPDGYEYCPDIDMCCPQCGLADEGPKLR